MQFAVPQFTDVEDKLIGSLTLKQFLVMLAAGGTILFVWSILGPSFPFFIISFPIAVAGVAIALGRYNGRPIFVYLVPFAAFLSSPRVRVFKREPDVVMVSKSEVSKAVSEASADPEILEPTESRLKKLAYLLDSKEKEEGEIISRDRDHVIQSPNTTKKSQIDLSEFVDRARNNIVEFTTKKIPNEVVSNTKTKPHSTQSVRQSTTAKPTKPKPQAKKFDPSSFLGK